MILKEEEAALREISEEVAKIHLGKFYRHRHGTPLFKELDTVSAQSWVMPMTLFMIVKVHLPSRSAFLVKFQVIQGENTGWIHLNLYGLKEALFLVSGEKE